MQVCKYFPVASDRMGMIWTISSIEGACIIEFGPAGTTHFAIEGIGSLNGEEKSKIYSTHMDQGDVTFGKYDRLENSILEIDENINPKYIFVMASSVSSVIGADVESVCSTMQDKVKAKLIPITTAGLKYDYTVGVENTLLLLINNVVKSNEVGTNIAIIALITINGPKGIYSSAFFFLETNIIILITAANKNAITATIIIFIHPKNKPKAPINLTSPNPIASFPAMRPPISVIIKKIPPPTIIPSILFINILIPAFVFIKTLANVKIKPVSKIVSVSLFGII